MRLSSEVKSTRLHRLYQVLFWTVVVAAVSLGAISLFASWSCATRRFELIGQLSQKGSPGSAEFNFWVDQISALARLEERHAAVVSFCSAVLVLLPLVALGYRLLNYILHGKAAFRQRASTPPSPDEEKSGTEPTGSKPDPFNVLDIPNSATFEEIKQANRTKMREYHPDKVASLGPELRELAERKARQINEAFQALCRQHGTG